MLTAYIEAAMGHATYERLPEDGVFYDIGSNWGWFTMHVASRPGFRGKIHAFEPFASSYADLCDLVRQAGLAGVVENVEEIS